MYAGIPSEAHNLYISTINGEAVVPLGAAASLITDRASKSIKDNLIAIDNSQPLVFDIEFTSPDPFDRFDTEVIASWLTEQQTWQKLQIEQSDLKNSYYNCIFTNMSNVYIRNKNYIFRCTVQCDSQFAWQIERVWERSYPDIFTNKDVFYNTSS